MSEESGHSDDIENILDKVRRNSIQLNYAHKMKYEKLKNKLVYFRLPTICLSAINSVFSVGLNSYMPQQQVSVINCLISLVCGIIVSVELYLQIEKAMSVEYDVSKSYYLLSIEIQRFLLTKRDNRTIDCMPFLDKSYNQYTKLFENSRLLKKSIHDTLTDLHDEDKLPGISISPTASEINSRTAAITQTIYNGAF
tara:strand:+ start:924 stop:1511 length:588 start_codon:yes stop_codon:yes gene_type:complete